MSQAALSPELVERMRLIRRRAVTEPLSVVQIEALLKLPTSKAEHVLTCEAIRRLVDAGDLIHKQLEQGGWSIPTFRGRTIFDPPRRES